MFVCCECCVMSGRGLCDELITRPDQSYRLWWVVVCDLETSKMRRPWPKLVRSATGKKTIYFRPKIFPSTVIESTARFAYLSGRDWCNMYIYHCCVDLVDNLVLYLCGLATSSVDQPELCNWKAAGAIGPASRHSEMVTTPRATLLTSNHCVVNSIEVCFFTVKVLQHATPER